jgi:hypothetical protein
MKYNYELWFAEKSPLVVNLNRIYAWVVPAPRGFKNI